MFVAFEPSKLTEEVKTHVPDAPSCWPRARPPAWA